jgi:hypothetical protein
VSGSGPVTSRPRPTIDERAERRARVESGGSDRYPSLVRALRAGQEVPLRERRGSRLEWHPIAGKLLLAALVGIAAYFSIVTAYNAWRDSQTETWAGPDTSVQSGQRLANCPPANAQHDDVFPTWVRFNGRVYVSTGRIRPVGTAPTPDYPLTPYTLGSLRLHTIANTPEGRAGTLILLRLSENEVGQVYEVNPDCS